MVHGPGLSSHERRILAEIEQALSSGDGELARRLPPEHTHTQRATAARYPTAGGICALAGLSLVLLAAAAATAWPLLMWCFTLVWASMLAATALHIRGWCDEQRPSSGGPPGRQ
ncbi:DUF3040 domain-containing protein [Streptomyces sp. NPDC048331]|uniref:DUF3040 domain-containing protein n=1 Tax=Streptomyces sp. NPDC048331 TaxID=3365534 RepID=UPI003721061C